jgi:2-oxoacid:acceptor oxidoreductase delta subunit (pyruvate/2-ketoisovalerate family)
VKVTSKKNRDQNRKFVYDSAAEMPPMAVSSFDMSFNRTGSWRTVRPEIDYEKCVYCLTCWLYCPEPAISLEPIMLKGKEREKPVIDYDYCKGCGICWTECPAEAIDVLEEEK